MEFLTLLFQRTVKVCFVFSLLSVSATGLMAQNSSENLPAKNFLDIASLKITAILPLPPAEGTPAGNEDEKVREDAVADANGGQLAAAKSEQWYESESQVGNAFLSYGDAMGYELFNPRQLPITAALFEKIDNDIDIAITDAKDIFKRSHPPGDNNTESYSYPSGHSTRAFVWATLLSNVFPEEKEALIEKARQKAWDKVILGDHYPADVYAGEIYGEYLTNMLLENPDFQQEWSKACQEINNWKHQSIFSDIWNEV